MARYPHSNASVACTLVAAMLLAWFGSTAPVRADQDDTQPPDVARISVVSGEAAVKQGEGDAVAAAVNAPLEAGDYISTGDDGRMEIELDPNNVVRAGADTQVRFTQLDGQADTVQLAQGTVELRVLQQDDDHVTVQTPSADVVPDESGAYLISVDANGMTEVTARSGSADINTPAGSQTIDPGRTMQITGAANNAQYQFIDEVAASDFDRWNDQRDQTLLADAGPPNVDNTITGAQDLDQYGEWHNVSGYGEVWQPNDVASDWTPYSQGAWVYENYYGPTWVASEPWGWAPYHYGTWAFIGNSWAWVPPSRPVYAPAMVAFFGFGGNGWGVGAGFGNVGWVPLAPGERLRPWWGNTSVTNVYQQNVTINNYRNSKNGFVGVPVTRWQQGSFTTITRLHPQSTGSAHIIAGRFPVAPTTANYRYTNRPVGSTVRVPAQPQRPQTITGQAPAQTQWHRFNEPNSSTPPARSYQHVQHVQTTSWQHFSEARTSAPIRTTYAQPRYPQQSIQQPRYVQPARYQPAPQQQTRYQPAPQQQTRYQQAYQPRAYQARPAQPARSQPSSNRGSPGSRPHGPGKP